jgi:hypothetical protein
MKVFLYQLNDQTSVRDLPKHRVMKVKITKLENIVLMHACNFRWAKNITILGWPTQSYCYRILCELKYVMKVKIAKLENIMLLHACNFRWAKNIILSHETGIF